MTTNQTRAKAKPALTVDTTDEINPPTESETVEVGSLGATPGVARYADEPWYGATPYDFSNIPTRDLLEVRSMISTAIEFRTNPQEEGV